MGYARRNFLVPIPSFVSFDALNLYLEGRCLERMEAKLRGHRETIGERMVRDLDALLPLPAVPYDASDSYTTRVSLCRWSGTGPTTTRFRSHTDTWTCW